MYSTYVYTIRCVFKGEKQDLLSRLTLQFLATVTVLGILQS